MSSNEIRTKAVVMRTASMGESAKAATCFTRELGKISVAAAGAKKITGKFGGATQIFALSNMRIVKGRSNMYTLVGAEVIDSFYNITADYDVYNTACNITIKIMNVIQEELEDTELFDLYVFTLALLNKNIKKHEFVETVFYIKMLEISGWAPELEELNDKGYKHATLRAIEYILENEIDKIYCFTISDDILTELKKVSDTLLNRFLN